MYDTEVKAADPTPLPLLQPHTQSARTTKREAAVIAGDPSPAQATGSTFWLVVVGSLLLLALGIRHYLPFISDDAFISLRYSERLLQGKGLTWSDGQRVEGYTNLLWVLLCSLLGVLHVDLVLATRLLGIGCTLFAFAALASYIYRRFPPADRLAASLCGLVSFALSAPILVWAIGGLEQPLLLALLAWATIFTLRFLQSDDPSALLPAGLLLGLATITRADGFLFALLYTAVVLAAGLAARRGLAPAVRVLAIPSLFLLGQLAFRRFYYAEWLPNTAYVKVSFTLHRLVTGFAYVAKGVRTEPLLLVLAILGCAILYRRREWSSVLLFAGVPVVYSAYLIVIGGDIFPAARHMLPVYLLCCFAASEAGRLAYTAGGDRLDARSARRHLRPAAALLLALCVASIAFSQHWSRGAYVERWEWEGKSLGLFFQSAFAPHHALLVSDGAGAVPFFSRLDAIDPLGLCDRHIAHHASAEKGHDFLGHELGDGQYVLDQKPDLIVFGMPTGSIEPVFHSDEQIARDPRFAALYQLVHFHVAGHPGLESDVYVRRLDGRLGIQVTPDRIRIPAFFATPVAPAFIAASVPDGASLVLPAGATATIARVPLPPGTWRAAGDASSATYRLQAPSGTDPNPLASITITNPSATTLHLHEAVLNRAPGGKLLLSASAPAPR